MILYRNKLLVLANIILKCLQPCRAAFPKIKLHFTLIINIQLQYTHIGLHTKLCMSCYENSIVIFIFAIKQTSYVASENFEVHS
jgi:hypothetical protein